MDGSQDAGGASAPMPCDADDSSFARPESSSGRLDYDVS